MTFENGISRCQPAKVGQIRDHSASDSGKLSILIIGSDSFETSPGGLNRYMRDLSAALIATGLNIRAVVLGPGGSSEPTVVGVSRPDAPLLHRLYSMFRASYRSLSGAQIVDIHFALYGAPLLLSRRMRDKTVVVHFQGPWSAESRNEGQSWIISQTKALIERWVYRKADVVIVLSESFAEIIVERYGIPRGRVHIIPPGVDLDTFKPSASTSIACAGHEHSDDFLVVCVRRLTPRMGIDVLIRAWSTVQRQVPHARLVIVGEGNERSRLEYLVEQTSPELAIQFLGKVDDSRLVDMLRRADCTVVPSTALEGFGLVTLESLACGTPVVVTNIGGLPDAVRGLDTSLIVQRNDEVALSKRLIEAAQGALPTRDACRAHAERFSWLETAGRHEDLYRHLVAPKCLRVLFVDHTARLSGGELAMYRLATALDLEAEVVLAEDGPLRALLESGGMHVEVLPLPARTLNVRRGRVGVRAAREVVTTLSYAWRLSKLIRNREYSIVHTNSLKADLYGGIAGRLARVPVVWHVHDRLTSDYLPATAVRIMNTAGRLLPRAVIANSATTLRTLEGISKRKEVIACPVAGITPASPRTEGPLTVGMIGRLSPWKGQALFLRAFSIAFPDGDTRASLVGSALFGEDDYAADLRFLASRLGIAERVDFRGFRYDINREFARCDILVHASTLPEPFGMVVAEAMSAGIAVIVPDNGGPAELVEDGVSGLYYSTGDVNSLATVMKQVANDPGLRLSLGRNAMRSTDRFRPDLIAERVTRLYLDILEV